MEKFGQQLRDYWFIIMCLVSLVVGWTWFSARLQNAEAKIQELSTTNEQIKQIQIDVAIIQEKLSSENIKLQVRLGVGEALSLYEVER